MNEIKKYDEDYGNIVISALRYALGRRTYIVGLTCDYIKTHIDELSDRTVHILINDIKDAQSGRSFNNYCDEADWNDLKNFLQDVQLQRE